MRWALLLLIGACAAPKPRPKPPKPVCTSGPITEEVSFASGDGLKLFATYHSPCAGTARPTVVLAHQLCRARAEWQTEPHHWIRELAKRDLATLAVDLRGHGASNSWPDGSTRDLCAHARDLVVSSEIQDTSVASLYMGMVDDVRAAMAWVRNERHASAVALVGSSIGANSVLIAAAEDPSVAAVVGLSPGLDYRGLRPTQAAVRLGDRPVILEAAEDDRQSSAAVRELARQNVLLRTVIWPEGGHGNDMLRANPEELNALVDFLATHLAQ